VAYGRERNYELVCKCVLPLLGNSRQEHSSMMKTFWHILGVVAHVIRHVAG